LHSDQNISDVFPCKGGYYQNISDVFPCEGGYYQNRSDVFPCEGGYWTMIRNETKIHYPSVVARNGNVIPLDTHSRDRMARDETPYLQLIL
jgi:hypothetical protein